jgi:long-chain acyl-CoA synthetase
MGLGERMGETHDKTPWLKHYPKGVDWHALLNPQPVYALLQEAARQYPSAHALCFYGRRTTYAELAEQVSRLAAGLQKIGVRRGVKVGLCLPNCPQFVIAYYAILQCGGTVVNYSPLYVGKEIAHQVSDSDTEIMITLSLKALYPKVAESLGKTPLKKIIVSDLQWALPKVKAVAFSLLKRKELASIPKDEKHLRWDDLIAHAPQTIPAAVHPDSDIAVIQYTGGTTGTPKGVVLTHANLHINTQQCALWFHEAVKGGEVIMGALPLFHVFAMTTVMNFGMHIAAELVLHPKVDITAVLKDIQKRKATLMPGVSTLFNAINRHPKLSRFNLRSLKYCISGGGPLPVQVKKDFEASTGCVLVEGYGLSETSPVVTCNPLKGENKAGSIGLPLPQTILQIVSLEDGETLLPAGQTGEICIQGPQVMHGYRHQLEENNRTMRNGRLHTGDVGYRDEDGYFYIVDRIKEMIISGGYNIYPRHIEEALYKHVCVGECAVIGVPHDKYVEVPKAFVVFKEGHVTTEEDLITFLKTELPGYAVPRQFEFRNTLPKTLVGKVDKKALRG